MKPCYLTITTTADGVETEISREGEIELSATKTVLVYKEEQAIVRFTLQGESAFVERQGDYSMRLCLERGKRREGALGLGSAEGVIQTYTHRVAYAIGNNSLLASLRYDLLVNDEPQQMKIRLLARLK
jgi:uncharacterized beta-barrel protein YwiB (DUF1934 family)